MNATVSAFDRANVAFAHCVRDAGLWWLALPALFVVSTTGRLLYQFSSKRKEDDIK